LYRQMGEPVPAGVRSRPDYEAAFRLWELDGGRPLKGARNSASLDQTDFQGP
jgi:hypothetical protein